MNSPRLSPEDQARVDQVIRGGVNSVERKPFRHGILLSLIVVILLVLGGLSYLIAWLEGAI